MEFKKFIFSKGVLLALAVTIFYGIFMISIYFSGYKAIPDKIKDLPIAVISNDSDSQELKDNLVKKLPFNTIHKNWTLNRAKKELNKRSIYLIVEIPKDFSNNVKTLDKTAKLHFYINESNPTTAVTAMESVATKIGASINENILLNKGKAILTNAQLTILKEQVAQKVAATPQAKEQIATQAEVQKNQIETKINQTYKNLGNSFMTVIHKTNKVPSGMNHSMSPFFISLSIYIGTLMGATIILETYTKFAGRIGRFKSFAMLEAATILISVITPLIIVLLAQAFNKFDSSLITSLWFTHGLELFTAMNINLIFIILIGQLGMIINVPMMLMQVVAGAGLIPKIILPSFFKGFSTISPCYYSIQADFNVLYGGSGTGDLWLKLFCVALVAVLLNLLAVTIRKKNLSGEAL